MCVMAPEPTVLLLDGKVQAKVCNLIYQYIPEAVTFFFNI